MFVCVVCVCMCIDWSLSPVLSLFVPFFTISVSTCELGSHIGMWSYFFTLLNTTLLLLLFFSLLWSSFLQVAYLSHQNLSLFFPLELSPLFLPFHYFNCSFSPWLFPTSLCLSFPPSRDMSSRWVPTPLQRLFFLSFLLVLPIAISSRGAHAYRTGNN